MCITAEPENVRQPHVLLEIHGKGEGEELDLCAGIMALTAQWEQTSLCIHAPTLPAQPCPAAHDVPGVQHHAPWDAQGGQGVVAPILL